LTRITNDELKNSRRNLSRCGHREEAALKRKNKKFKILLEDTNYSLSENGQNRKNNREGTMEKEILFNYFPALRDFL